MLMVLYEIQSIATLNLKSLTVFEISPPPAWVDAMTATMTKTPLKHLCDTHEIIVETRIKHP